MAVIDFLRLFDECKMDKPGRRKPSEDCSGKTAICLGDDGQSKSVVNYLLVISCMYLSIISHHILVTISESSAYRHAGLRSAQHWELSRALSSGGC